MSKTKEVKTNAMRMLDRMKIPYEAHTYECEEFRWQICCTCLMRKYIRRW